MAGKPIRVRVTSECKPGEVVLVALTNCEQDFFDKCVTWNTKRKGTANAIGQFPVIVMRSELQGAKTPFTEV